MAKKKAKRAPVKMKPFMIRVPSRVVARLDKLAVDLGISRNNLCERLLTAAVDQDMEKAAATLFATLGLEDVIKAAAESALLDAARKLRT